MSDTYDYAVPDVGMMNGNSVHQPLIVMQPPPPPPPPTVKIPVPIEMDALGTAASSGSSSASAARTSGSKNNNHQQTVGLYGVSESSPVPVKKVNDRAQYLGANSPRRRHATRCSPHTINRLRQMDRGVGAGEMPIDSDSLFPLLREMSPRE